MAGINGHDDARLAYENHDDENALLSARGLEAFGRKVTTTAGHLMGPLTDPAAGAHYHHAMTDLHMQLRRPSLQRSVFSYARTSPSDIVRSRLSTAEIQHRALAYVPDDLLSSIPEDRNSYSLFQGFQASLPDADELPKKHRRKHSRGRKLLDAPDSGSATPVGKLQTEKTRIDHRLEMLAIRKNMASSEIYELDSKIANLADMRKIVLERLAGLEQEESALEHDLLDLESRLEDATEAEAVAAAAAHMDAAAAGETAMEASFMSESIYEKLPSPQSTPTKSKKPKTIRRKSMPILHEHFEPGSKIREIPAHYDMITALDFDVPFGTLVTAALDDTVRVWDMNAGRCMGLLEGHTASVRALQVEDNLLATGSMDATIRLWDLSRARYEPQGSRINKDDDEDDDGPVAPPQGTMEDCPLFSLTSHVDEVTALHFRGDTLVSGSADKTLRQWDLNKGRCVQTLDVMWAAAQATAAGTAAPWRTTSRMMDASASFVGALQVFDAALACGTADGMVRLWDLRSGQVHRSLVGHTGPVTALQFDDVHLVTGSLDRSIRIWDLRMGSIHDAYAYDQPVTSMMFDSKSILAAAGETFVKVYDKTEGRQWDCGAGVDPDESTTNTRPAVVDHVRVKDGYITEGRRDGAVGIWTC